MGDPEFGRGAVESIGEEEGFADDVRAPLLRRNMDDDREQKKLFRHNKLKESNVEDCERDVGVAELRIRKPIEQRYWWKCLHISFFLVASLLFVGGTAFYFNVSYAPGAYIGSWMYIVGAFGFVFGDIQEFLTWRNRCDNSLLVNIAISFMGSLSYTIGSAGYVPEILSITPAIGEWSFIVGSIFIMISQAWRIVRVGTQPAKASPRNRERLSQTSNADEVAPPVNRIETHDDNDALNTETNEAGAEAEHPRSGEVDGEGEPEMVFRFSHLCNSLDSLTQLGLEGSSFLGALFFLIGTGMYVVGPLKGTNYTIIISLWMIGSLAFTAGALFMAFRHVVMGW